MEINNNKRQEKHFLCFDVGLTGFFSIIKCSNGVFEVIHSEALQTEEKEDFLFKTDTKTKSKAIVKKQISFTKNFDRIDYLFKKHNINKNKCLALTEQLTPRPISSRVSVLSLGDTNGACRAVFEALGLGYIVIPPAIWKKGLGITSEKETSIAFFQKNITIRAEVLPFFKKMKNHNQIESVLIAYWYFLQS